MSLRRTVLTAKCPYGEMSYSEMSYGEKSDGEKSGNPCARWRSDIKVVKGLPERCFMLLLKGTFDKRLKS